MKKFLIYAGIVIVLLLGGYYTFVYFASYSKGYRAGELIKISHKGVIFRTWEGELAQGVSESQFFQFSVTDEEIIEELKELQGHRVKLTYKERFRTFAWWGDTRYFIVDVEETDSSGSSESQSKEE
jgi:hypothetical protein